MCFAIYNNDQKIGMITILLVMQRAVDKSVRREKFNTYHTCCSVRVSSACAPTNYNSLVIIWACGAMILIAIFESMHN